MPLSEFLKMARGKLDSGQEKRSSTTDPSPSLEDELVELVWENGQIVMQSQSSRAKKSPTFSNLPSSSPRVKDKFTGNSSTPKIGKFGVMDSMFDNMPLSVPNDEMELTEEDEVVPWLSYSANDSPQQDYNSPLFPEISGLMVNESSGRRGFASIDKRGLSNQMNGASHSVTIRNIVNSEQGNASKLSPSTFKAPKKSSSLILPLRSRVSDIISSNTSCNMPVSAFGYSNSSQASAGVIKSMKMQKQNIPENSSSLLNFAPFSRPITGGSAVSGSSTIGARGAIERENGGSSRNRVSVVPFESYFSSEKENDVHSPPYMASSKVESKGSVGLHEMACPIEQSDIFCGDSPSNNDMSRDQFTGSNAIKEFPDGEKNVEPVVVCSSVCSGSSAERESSDHPRTLKRKTRDSEESEFQSEDIEEEYVCTKSAYPSRGGAGSKRSRAAEVHNLSERRRRDRINEKMRALQDLIPNCNKVDKASMLDEAIEYLKTLQVQVQMMSMGAGLCAPPMMFPAGIQYMHAANVPQFSPMGLGMGMGFGMGKLEMNGGSPGCSIYPIPTMQGAHLRSPPVSGSATFPGVAGSNLHSFRHPGQGLPVSVSPASLFPMAGQPSTNAAVGLNIRTAGVHTDIRNTSNFRPRNQGHAKNSHIMNNADPSS